MPASGVIRRPGNYRLDRDILASGPVGIEVSANDIYLDLANHRVTAAPATPDRKTFAIRARCNSKLTVRNGTVSGGWCGLHCTQLKGGDIANVIFEDSDQVGLVSQSCHDLRVTDCRFTTTVKPLVRPSGESYAIGLNVSGHNIALARNKVTIVYDNVDQDEPPLETIGILIGADSRNVRVTGNRIAAGRALPASYGVWAGVKATLEVSDNSIENMDYGLAIADSAVAHVANNSFTCAPDQTRTGSQRVCTAGLFARAADLHESANRIDGYATAITRYDPVASGHQPQEPLSSP